VETTAAEEKSGKGLTIQQVMHTVNNCEHRSGTPEFTGMKPDPSFDSDFNPQVIPTCG
jgi:hypothetical protein